MGVCLGETLLLLRCENRKAASHAGWPASKPLLLRLHYTVPDLLLLLLLSSCVNRLVTQPATAALTAHSRQHAGSQTLPTADAAPACCTALLLPALLLLSCCCCWLPACHSPAATTHICLLLFLVIIYSSDIIKEVRCAGLFAAAATIVIVVIIILRQDSTRHSSSLHAPPTNWQCSRQHNDKMQLQLQHCKRRDLCSVAGGCDSSTHVMCKAMQDVLCTRMPGTRALTGCCPGTEHCHRELVVCVQVSRVVLHQVQIYADKWGCEQVDTVLLLLLVLLCCLW